jgi:hypothetical protein
MPAAINCTVLPSASLTTRATVTISGYPKVATCYLGIGIAASTPATYGGMTSAFILQAVFMDVLQIQLAPGQASLSAQFDFDAAGSAGDKWWVCLFENSPISSSVPLAVAGPLTQSV